MVKPKWEVDERNGIIYADNLIFSSRALIGRDFFDLIDGDYGEGFVMPTAPQLVSFFYSAWKNKENDKYAAEVLDKFENMSHVTNTRALLFHDKGIYFQDRHNLERYWYGNPDGEEYRRLTENEIRKLDSEKRDKCECVLDWVKSDLDDLEEKLKCDSYKTNDVIFSKDGALRFVPCDSYPDQHYPDERPGYFSRDPRVTAFAGGYEQAKKLDEMTQSADFWSRRFSYGNGHSLEAYDAVCSLSISFGKLHISGNTSTIRDHISDCIAFGVKDQDGITSRKNLPFYGPAKKAEMTYDPITGNTGIKIYPNMVKWSLFGKLKSLLTK